MSLNQPSVQTLSVRNLSPVAAVAFKIKTTNPRRYSVRPNIGLIWGGESASVLIQVPAMPALPDATKGNDPQKTAAALRKDVFYRMGFNDREIVALSGAHALGRCHPDASGYTGASR